MAKQSVLEREKKRHTMRIKYHSQRKLLKELLKNSCSQLEKDLIYRKLCSLPRDSSLIRKRNRCCITGRGRGVYRLFGLSRMAIRELASRGELPGLTKSSW